MTLGIASGVLDRARAGQNFLRVLCQDLSAKGVRLWHSLAHLIAPLWLNLQLG